MRLRIIVLVCFLASAALAQRVVPADGGNAVFTAPTSSITLQVSVFDDAGQPKQGASVLFIAPDYGATGEFTLGAGNRQTRVATDSNGVASAVLNTNSVPGPFLVSAWLEGTLASAHIAVSNALSPPPALDAQTLTQAVRSQLNPAPDAVLYGPFLLDAGSVLAPAGGVPPAAPQQIASPSILFWLDDNPGALFEHPVRWVLIDAADGGPVVNPVTRNWAPYVMAPGADTGYQLTAPLFGIADSDLLPASPAAQAAHLNYLQPRGDGSNKDACAVLVYGSDNNTHFGEGAFLNVESSMHGVMSDTLNIPGSNIFEDTTPGTFYGVNHQASTRSRLQGLIQKAAQIHCKKLYFFYVGHGHNGGVGLMKDAADKSTNSYDSYAYADLAKELEATKIPKICVIIHACHAGSAIAPLQGHGFDGEIATASDADSLSYYQSTPGFRTVFWPQALATTWQALGSSYSLTNVANAMVDKQKQNNDSTAALILKAMPRTAIIEAQGGKAAAPAQVVIMDYSDASQNPIQIKVTKPANFPDGAGAVEMFITDVTVAKDPSTLPDSTGPGNNSRIAIPAGTNSTTFTVQGFKEGITAYTITWTDRDQKTYKGMGTIIVGKGYAAAPNPLQVQTGRSGDVIISRSLALAQIDERVELTIKPADAASAAIAIPDANLIGFPLGATSRSVLFKGLKPGTATYIASDGQSSVRFQVVVSDPVVANCNTFSEGDLFLNIQNTSDLDRSAGQINMPKTAMTHVRKKRKSGGDGSTLEITSPIPQIPSGEGPFDPATCKGSFTVTATQPIAGATYVQVGYDIDFGAPPFANVRMIVRIGLNGSLYNDPHTTDYLGTGAISNPIFSNP